jgi:WXG100 family type VII secretion target
MPNTTDYDAVKNIHVEPDTLKTIADTLTQHAQDVASSIGNITNTLTDLQLGWAGQSAQEAEDFDNRWVQVMTELFGTKNDPSKGVLNAIVDGLLTARAGFSTTEQALKGMFHNFTDALDKQAQPNSDNSTTPPPNMIDPNQTAINETF